MHPPELKHSIAPLFKKNNTKDCDISGNWHQNRSKVPKGEKNCSVVLNLLRFSTTYAQLADTWLINTVLLRAFIHSFSKSIVVLGQVHKSPTNRIFHSELVRPLSVSRILSFPWGNPVVASVFFPVSSLLLSFCYLSFNNVYQKAVSTQDKTNPDSQPSDYYM